MNNTGDLLLEGLISLLDKVSTRMDVWTIDNQLSHEMYVCHGYPVWVREYLSNMDGNGHLVNLKVRVWRYDCSA